MLLDAAAARALAAIILTSTQGVERLTPQLPLQSVDRGENWFVRGTPFRDTLFQAENSAFWIFFRKASAEVVGLGFDGTSIRSEQEIKMLRGEVTPDEVARLLAPRRHWEPGGSAFVKHMSMNLALYGGLVNTPADAVAYAHVLMSTKPALASVPESALKAEERDKVWHITAAQRPGEVMTVSRTDGRLLSGDL